MSTPAAIGAVSQATRVALLSLQRQVQAALAGAASPGDVKASAATAAPAGWLSCDGSSLLRTAYPDLFAAIGVTWGAVDGTHFTLPDLRGRTIIGVGTGAGLTARALAANVGVEAVTLTSAQSGVPAHTHNLSTEGGSSTYRMSGVGSGGFSPAQASQANTAADAASSHTNMQPSAALNYVIKT